MKSKHERILKYFSEIVKAREALKKEDIIRTNRDITGDYAEYLAAKQYKLRLIKNNVNKTYDAIDDQGKTYQIKSRKVKKVGENTSFDFHNYDKFDFLIFYLFNKATWEPVFKTNNKIPFTFVKKHWKENKNRKSLRWTSVRKWLSNKKS